MDAGSGQNNAIYNITQSHKTPPQRGLFCEASEVQVLLMLSQRCLNTTVISLQGVNVLCLCGKMCFPVIFVHVIYYHKLDVDNKIDNHQEVNVKIQHRK